VKKEKGRVLKSRPDVSGSKGTVKEQRGGGRKGALLLEASTKTWRGESEESRQRRPGAPQDGNEKENGWGTKGIIRTCGQNRKPKRT